MKNILFWHFVPEEYCFFHLGKSVPISLIFKLSFLDLDILLKRVSATSYKKNFLNISHTAANRLAGNGIGSFSDILFQGPCLDNCHWLSLRARDLKIRFLMLWGMAKKLLVFIGEYLTQLVHRKLFKTWPDFIFVSHCTCIEHIVSDSNQPTPLLFSTYK